MYASIACFCECMHSFTASKSVLLCFLALYESETTFPHYVECVLLPMHVLSQQTVMQGDVLKVINWGISHHWFAFENLPNFHCKFVTFARNYTRMNRVASLHLKVRKENFSYSFNCTTAVDVPLITFPFKYAWYADLHHLISTSFISTIFFPYIFKKESSSLFFYSRKSKRMFVQLKLFL